jgi:hypothetical protein
MNVFLSHISDEALEARALKTALEKALPGSNIFVSASDIHLGQAWLDEIDHALVEAKVILTLCSPNSIRRPWINFESGSGWTRRIQVIPICHKAMRKDRLPDPLRIFQASELMDGESCQKIVSQLGSLLGLATAADFDPAKFLKALSVERPSRGAEIGIVLSHQQQQWEESDRAVFSFLKAVPAELKGDWVFRSITDERVFVSPQLHKLSGLMFCTPWRSKLEPDTISATVEWVKSGGRLLLLGFELGDRHHDANLAELTHHFGIDPATDIVGPPGYGPRKPYGVQVDFGIPKTETHPFVKGLATIQLTNAQTIRVEPGGREWLRVGANSVYQPVPESVVYRDGTMTTPGGAEFYENPNSGWQSVAVEAPKGLCGNGGVQMIGTWDIMGCRKAHGDENFILIRRLLDWLRNDNN